MSNHVKKLAVDIVSAYIAHVEIDATEVPRLIGAVYRALTQSAGHETPSDHHHVHDGHSHPPHADPAVDPQKSVFKDHIVCLEDGLEFKTIKRHIETSHGMSVDEYKRKWGLPYNYPMTAPGYAKRRSKIAKDMGLGRRDAG